MKFLQTLMIFLSFFILSACHLTRGTSGVAEALLANLLRVRDAVVTTMGGSGTATGTAPVPDVDDCATTAASPTAYPDTGQTLCYNSTTNISCGNASFPRQDADMTNIPLARNFTGPTQHPVFTSDYTTVDNTTGLTWRTCSIGLSNSDCTIGGATGLNWANANAACSNLNSLNVGSGYAGITSWRLPTYKELATLINHEPAGNTYENTYFPNIQTSLNPPNNEQYWTLSATTISVANDAAWSVHFQRGLMNPVLKTQSITATLRMYALCTSGPSLKVDSPNFCTKSDGVIKDKNTKLVWQKCSYGQNNDSDCTGTAATATWQNGLQYCNDLNLGGKQWRLPSINEFITIVNTDAMTSPYSYSVFPNTSGQYHTSTTAVYRNHDTQIQFDDGSTIKCNSGSCGTGNLKNQLWKIRCVANDL